VNILLRTDFHFSPVEIATIWSGRILRIAGISPIPPGFVGIHGRRIVLHLDSDVDDAPTCHITYWKTSAQRNRPMFSLICAIDSSILAIRGEIIIGTHPGI